MKIRGRLLVLLIQFAILLFATYLATGVFISSENWFMAGILAVIINPQILEPFYPKPADILGNSLIVLLLCVVSSKTVLYTGWIILIYIAIILVIFSIITMVLGSQKEKNVVKKISIVTKIITSEATSLRLFSLVFWLSLIEKYPNFDRPLWILSSAWLLIVTITLIDWKKISSTITTEKGNVFIEGMISPSVLLVSAKQVPMPGSLITIKAGSIIAEGVVVSRTRRIDDVWGQISISNQELCETLVNSTDVCISEKRSEFELVGSIEENSSENELVFYPTKNLQIGEIVTVIQDDLEIMYQVTSAKIHQTDIVGGAYFHPISRAIQIGIFNTDTLRIERLRWVPNLGSRLIKKENHFAIDETKVPPEIFKVGTIIGTELPIFINSDIAAEGHLTILGMTKMGKSTLATRYANFLGLRKNVTILDHTGEYINKKKLPAYEEGFLLESLGVSVYEPKLSDNLPSFTKEFLRKAVNEGRKEYEIGIPKSRIIFIDEAHQFIPEPALLAFGTPGREESIYTGSLLMQIRKYGLSIILISQRTAVVAKSALSQCENIIAFKSTDHTGLDYLESIVGNQVKDILPRLQQGEALVYGPAFSCDGPLIIKTIDE